MIGSRHRKRTSEHNDRQLHITMYMPDGRPAPFLLTGAELLAFCRVENVRFPADTIRRMRANGLAAVQISRRVLFRLDDVLEYLTLQQNRVPR